ncbi:phage portal protein [Paracoccus haeundaensis]|uniref:Phage portal protein n=1 Tax=Paracoccus haeundaensis TaxID=225362 RepID=A0A5C4RC41_9RHOB|nr:phage portal protein [Paracoccus haeundaensis]
MAWSMQLWPFTRKSLAAPEPALEAILGITPTASGISISVLEALKVPAVANAIQIISEAVASLDVHVKRIEGGVETEVTDHPVLTLLRGDANEWTSGFELIRQIMIDALVSDAGGMGWVNRVEDKAVEIISFRQGVLTFDTDTDTLERKYRLGNDPIPARDVIHLMPPQTRSPLNLARDAIAISVCLDRHAARLFSRGGRPSGVLQFAKGMAEEAVKKARAAWRQTHEGEDTGGQTAILYDGATFVPLSFNSTDSQFLENRRFQIEEIARAFNIPAPMIGDLSRATWSNSEQKGREFLSYTLEPWLRALEGAMNRALFSEEERGRYVVRFDRDDLTRADLSTRATVINSLISSQTLNPNEGRGWLGLPPRDGGDKFLNPNISAAPGAPKSAPTPEDANATE